MILSFFHNVFRWLLPQSSLHRGFFGKGSKPVPFPHWNRNHSLVISLDFFPIAHWSRYGDSFVLTLSQSSNFGIFQTERGCRRQFQI